MSANASIAVPSPRRVVHVRVIEPGVVEIAFSGYVTERSVDYAIDCISHLKSARIVLIEATSVDGYDTEVRGPGVRLLRALRNVGVERVVTVAPSSGVRLIAAAVSFVAALKVEFAPNRIEALKVIQQLMMNTTSV